MRGFARTCIPLVLLSAACFADEIGIEDVLDAKFREAERNIPKVIKQYAESIGCSSYLKRNNVVPYEMDGGKAYVAVIHLDNGCSGGVAMSRPVFILLKPAAFQMIKVDTDHSAPHQTSPKFPSLISRLYVRNGALWFQGKAFDLAKDANCCPSIYVTGRITYRKGEWVPVSPTSSSSNPAQESTPDGPSTDFTR